MSEVTSILSKIENGDAQAAKQLLPLVYSELRNLARIKLLDEKPDHSLQATALVHEAYLRLVGVDKPEQGWNSVGHFFAAAAEAMRRILIENIRRKRSQKRGGDYSRIELNSMSELASDDDDDSLLALNEALERFSASDPVKADLVKLRFFAGLTQAEAAKALGISLTTAGRYWSIARAWLQAEMASD